MYNGHTYFSKFTERLEFQFRKEEYRNHIKAVNKI